jgi:hypothetical protein
MTAGPGAYRLIGFAPDGTRLVGYDSTAEAGFADKPVALDLASGAVADIARFPSGMASNGTTQEQIDRINDATGSAITTTGDAKGQLTWVVRTGSTDVTLATPGTELTGAAWADSSEIVEVGPATISTPPRPSGSTPVPAGSALGVWRLADPTGTPEMVVAYPNADRPASGGPSFTGVLLSARAGDALVAIGGPPCCVPSDNRSGVERVSLVDLSAGRTVDAQLPDGAPTGTLLNFAGWIPAS